MKRLVALIFALAVCGAGASARPGAYRTVKNIAYRDAGATGTSTRCAGWTSIIRRIRKAFRPSYGIMAAA